MLLHVISGSACGVFAWTLLEYVIHYWLGHLPKGKTLISSEHLKHHKDILYFTPIPTKIRGAAPLLLFLGAGATLLIDPWFSVGFVAAVAMGWTSYEILHQSIHVRGPVTAYGRWATKNHLYHHFMRPNRNHGVTTPIWDYVFRTHDAVNRVSIRERDAETVPWLASGFGDKDDAPAFLGDYDIRRAAD